MTKQKRGDATVIKKMPTALIAILFFFLLFGSFFGTEDPVFAGTLQESLRAVIAAKNNVPAGGGGSCTTSDDTELLETVTVVNIDTSFDVQAATRYRAQSFNVNCTGTFMLTAYNLTLVRTVNGNNFVASLFTNSGTVPGSEVADTTVTKAWTSVSSSLTSYELALASPKSGLECGTTYWLVARSDHADAQGSIGGDIDGGYADGLAGYDLSYPSSWDVTTHATRDIRVVIMGCQE